MSPETLLLTALGLVLVLLKGLLRRGRVLRTVRIHLDAYLSACQLSITLASLGLGWTGELAPKSMAIRRTESVAMSTALSL